MPEDTPAVAEELTSAQFFERSVTTPRRWEMASTSVLLRARRDAARSKRNIEAISQREQDSGASWRRRDADVDDAMRSKVEASRDIVAKIEVTVRELDERLAALRKADGELAAEQNKHMDRLKVTQHCLQRRTQRPERERVRDSVETALEEEAGELALALRDAEQTRKKVAEKEHRLLVLRAKLCKDQDNKKASLDVDERMITQYREMNTKTRSQLFVEAKMAQLSKQFLPEVVGAGKSLQNR
jgi:hypothetical protein